MVTLPHPTLKFLANAQRHLLNQVFCGQVIGFATDPEWATLREACWILRCAYMDVLTEIQRTN